MARRRGKRRYNKKGCNKAQVQCIKQVATKLLKKNTETKQAVGGATQEEIDNDTPLIDDLTSIITQSDDARGRIGDVVTIKNIKIKMMLRNGLTATSNEYTLFRVVVFQYLTPTPATDPDQAKMYITNAISGGAVGATSFRNQDYMSNYVFLYDKVHFTQLGSPVAAAAGQPNSNKYITFNVPLKYMRKKIHFIGNGTTSTNGIWLGVWGSAADPGNGPTVAYDYQILYNDS